MATKIIKETTLPAPDKKRVMNTHEERYDDRQSNKPIDSAVQPRFIESLDRFFTTVFNTLPKGALIIEDMIIKGNRVIVRYKTQSDQNLENISFINNRQVVTINSFDTLGLDDGKVMERRNMIYQVKTLPES